MISTKIILNIVRRLLVAAGAALAVVAVGLRINRPEDQLALDQAIDPCLMERTPQLVIDMRSVDDAVASLNSHFSLKAERWTYAGPSEGPQWHPPGELKSEGAARLHDATQASAVARILRRFSYADNELGYCIKEGVLRIGPENMDLRHAALARG